MLRTTLKTATNKLLRYINLRSYSTQLISKKSQESSTTNYNHHVHDEYSKWNSNQVAEILCSPITSGGAGIERKEANILHESKFSGNDLFRIVKLIKQNKTKKKAKQYLHSFLKGSILSKTLVSITCLRILYWIDEELINKKLNDRHFILRELFECTNHLTIKTPPTNQFVQSFGKEFPLQNVELSIEQFSNAIKKEIKTLIETSDIDKQIFQSFLIASAYGTGTSRLNLELPNIAIEYLKKCPNSIQSIPYLENSIHLFISFKNETAYLPEMEISPIHILTSRILYSYFSRFKNLSFLQFLENKYLYNCSIREAISIIRNDKELNELKKDEPLIIFLSIDEFQEISSENLYKQVKEICHSMFSCWQDLKVLIIPIYSGINYFEMDRILLNNRIN